MKRILAVCKCTGGTNAVRPVADLLAKDYSVEWIDHDRGEDVKYHPDAIITSVCSRVGRDIIRYFRQTTDRPLTIAVNDQWTSGLNIWQEVNFKPDFVFVNDEFDRRLVIDAWGGFSQSRVLISGYPAMDKYANFSIEEAKVRVSESLGIDVSGHIPVVLFAGQWWQTGHAILETVDTLNGFGKFVHFIPRAHPKMTVESPEELPAWEKALSRFNSGNLVVNSSSCNISDLIGVSTIVVSMFSTVLQEAAILRKQNIAVLYPKTGGRVYNTECGIDVSQYPLIALGCTALATNRKELTGHMARALSNQLDLTENQRKTFKLDGKNAQRVADFIKVELGKS